MTHTRRSFLGNLSVLGLGAGAAHLLSGCGPEASDFDPSLDDTALSEAELRSCSAIGVTIGTNHGHTLTVPPSDVAAGVAKTYTMPGSHTHRVTLTAANFATLKSTGTLVVTSTNDAFHTHQVTVQCTGPEVVTDRCARGASATTISANHGHSLAVPRADVVAGVAKTYSIRGTSGHSHTVSITAAQFATLKTGASVVLTASTDAGHSHRVTVVCAA